MPRRKPRNPASTDPALQALIAKYRNYGDYEERDLSDLNYLRYENDDALLHLVSWNGGPDEISLLVASWADINLPGDIGYTPLHYAAGWGKQGNVIRLLALGADMSLTNIFGETAEHIAKISAGIYPERKKVYVQIAKLLRQARQRIPLSVETDTRG